MHVDPQTSSEETRVACVPSMRTAVLQTAAATVWCAGILFATLTFTSDDAELRRLLAQASVNPFEVKSLTLPRAAGAAGERTARAPGAADARRRAAVGTSAPSGFPAAGGGSAGRIATTISLSQRTGTAPGEATSPISATGDGAATLTLDGGGDGIVPRIVLRAGRPGSVGTMSIRVRNTGTAAAPLALTRGAIADTPGPFGGNLSSRLVLRVSDAVGGAVRSSAVLASTGTIPLGAVPPRGSRSWTVSLEFPDGGIPASARSGDNAFQGSAVDARLAVVERPAR